MKTRCAIIFSAGLAGCGTINTTFSSDSVAANKLGRWKSNCSYIPRVYSGVPLDFCALNGEPRAFRGQELRPSVSLILADMVLSGVADTLVLPYTLYLQSERGSVVASRLSD